ncbi:MAG: response regulator [Nitrospiraceae bacterium]|nr:response regulator [Nitrospiraceae bacterium]
MKKIIMARNSNQSIEREKSILKRSNLKIFHAGSGRETYDTHKKELVDLIIADLDLPDIKGDKLCTAIRDDDKLKYVSLILVCDNNKEDVIRCMNSKANSYLTKPVEPLQFFEKIGQLLNIPERRAHRILLKIDVEGKHKDSSFLCSSKNLSTAGILFETDKELNAGDVITCSFKLPNNERITADGEIVRVAKSGIRNFDYGVKFISISPEHTGLIDFFVKTAK